MDILLKLSVIGPLLLVCSFSAQAALTEKQKAQKIIICNEINLAIGHARDRERGAKISGYSGYSGYSGQTRKQLNRLYWDEKCILVRSSLKMP